jgi:hypothetical protein
MKWFLTLTLLISLSSAAGDYFSLPVGAENVGPVTLEKAHRIGSYLYLQHFNEVLTKTSKPLVIQLQWDSPYFGAGAIQDDSFVSVRVFGGMVRTPEMTEDIYALILCHELGHMIGGEPYQDIPGAEWTSVEGQADFFAASVCLPRYFKTLEPSLSVALIRQRIELAGLGFIHLSQKYATFTQEPASLEKTAPEVATVLNRRSYPGDQCRLDTFKAGARCLTEATCRAPVCWLPK